MASASQPPNQPNFARLAHLKPLENPPILIPPEYALRFSSQTHSSQFVLYPVWPTTAVPATALAMSSCPFGG